MVPTLIATTSNECSFAGRNCETRAFASFRTLGANHGVAIGSLVLGGGDDAHNFDSPLSSGFLSAPPGHDARSRSSHPGIDDGLRFAAGVLFLLTLAVAAASVGRLRLSLSVPNSLREAALIAFALSGLLQAWAMIVNPFFSPLVRLQTERGHRVIQHGPYRFMRHPGYLAMCAAIPTSALAIGSWLALAPAAGFIAVIIRRAQLEDEFLTTNLRGYKTYAAFVPSGLPSRPRHVERKS